MICNRDQLLFLRKALLVSGLSIGLLAGCSLFGADPTVDQSTLESAQASLAEGDGERAETILNQMLTHGASVPDLAAYLGEAGLIQNDLAEARKWLAPGEFSAETAGYGFQLLGRLELREGNLPASGTAFNRALDIDPDVPSLWVDIGRLRYQGGEQLQAIDAAEEALRLGPQDPAALHFRAQLARDADGPIPSLALLENALEIAPKDVALLTDYAATLIEAGRIKDGLVAIREVAKIAPEAPRIHFLQAVIAARAGQFDLARGLLLRASQTERDQPAGQLLAGILEMEAENFASAAQIFDQLYARQPDNHVVRRLLMRALLVGGAEEELIARFAEIAQKPEESAYLKATLARAYEALDRREEAGRMLDQAARQTQLVLVPLPSSIPRESVDIVRGEDGRTTRDLVRALIAPGFAAAAQERAQRFANSFPGSGDALSLLGDARLASGNPLAALQAYDQAARIRTSWPLVRRQMIAQIALGEQKNADRVLRDYLLSGGRSAEAAGLYARVLAAQSDWEKAAEILDVAIASGTGRAPDVVALRSEAARRLGRDDEALAFAWRAYRLKPLHPPAITVLMKATDDPVLRERMETKLAALRLAPR